MTKKDKTVILDDQDHKIRLFYRTKRNLGTTPKAYESNTEPSQTKPGETRTIKQLIERLQLGVPLPDKGAGYMDVDLDQVDHLFQQALDLVDIDDLNDRIRSTKDYIKQAMEEKARYEAAEAKKERDAARDLEIKEAIEKAKQNS